MAFWQDLIKNIATSQGAEPFGTVANNLAEAQEKENKDRSSMFVASPYKERPWDVPTIKEMIEKLNPPKIEEVSDNQPQENSVGLEATPTVLKKNTQKNLTVPQVQAEQLPVVSEQIAPKTDEEMSKLLSQYKKDLNWENFGADLEKAAETAYGHLGISSDEEGYKRRLKQVGMPVEMLEKQREADAKLQEKQKAEEYSNPASERSKVARNMAKQYLGIAGLTSMSNQINENMSAEQVDSLTKGIFKDAVNQQMDMKRLQESIAARKEIAAGRDQDKEAALRDRTKATEEKKKMALNEVSQRQQDINDNLGDLQKMIEDKGTFELFGSHNQDLDRKVDQIATDMAKLMDPNSVARPGEVELVKQGLVQSGFKNRNASAEQIVQNFKNEVNRRADVAYKIRGLETPPLINREKQSLPKERIIGGKKYILQNDGSYEEAD